MRAAFPRTGLLGEVEPGVPFGMARDGTLVCTKAGGIRHSPAPLARCVARLKREMKTLMSLPVSASPWATPRASARSRHESARAHREVYEFCRRV
jgi:hypothetical protein